MLLLNVIITSAIQVTSSTKALAGDNIVNLISILTSDQDILPGELETTTQLVINVFDQDNILVQRNATLTIESPSASFIPKMLGWIPASQVSDSVFTCNTLSTTLESLLDLEYASASQEIIQESIEEIINGTQIGRRRLSQNTAIQTSRPCSVTESSSKNCPAPETCYAWEVDGEPIYLFCVLCQGLLCTDLETQCGLAKDITDTGYADIDPCSQITCNLNEICVRRFVGSGFAPFCEPSATNIGSNVLNPARCLDSVTTSALSAIATDKFKSLNSLIATSREFIEAALESTQTFADELVEEILIAQETFEEFIERSRNIVEAFQTVGEIIAGISEQTEQIQNDALTTAIRAQTLDTEFQTKLLQVYDVETAKLNLQNVSDTLDLFFEIIDDLNQLLFIQTQYLVYTDDVNSNSIKSARYALRRINDLLLQTTERYQASFAFQERRDQRIQQGLIPFGKNSVRALGFVPRRIVGNTDESEYWYQAQIVHQFTMPVPLVAPDDISLVEYVLLDPDFFWLTDMEFPVQLQVAESYQGNISSINPTSTSTWLISTIVEFYADLEYLNTQRDSWFTFQDIMHLIGPNNCDTFPSRGETISENETNSGLLCHGWVVVRRSRCLVSNPSFTAPNAGFMFEEFDETLCSPLNNKNNLFYDLVAQYAAEAIADPSNDISNLAISRLPKNEIVTDYTTLNRYLEIVCQTPLTFNTSRYFGSNIVPTDAPDDVFVGRFKEAPSLTDGCATHWSEIKQQYIQNNYTITLPYLFYRTAQKVSKNIFRTNLTQWDIDLYGILSNDLDIQFIPYFVPGSLVQFRKPNLDLFRSTNGDNQIQNLIEHNQIRELPSVARAQNCRVNTGQFTDRNLIPVWQLLFGDYSFSYQVDVYDENGQVVVQSFTDTIPAGPAMDSILTAGYLSCINNKCIFNQSYVYDFLDGQICGHPDPILRQYCADYLMLFLEQPTLQTADPYGNRNIDQNQNRAFSLNCNKAITNPSEPCLIANFFQNPELISVDAAETWSRQNQQSEYEPLKQGISAHEAAVFLIPFYDNSSNLSTAQIDILATDVLEKKCDVDQLSSKGRSITMGPFCKFINDHKLKFQSFSIFEFDLFGEVAFHKRQWSENFDLVLPGSLISRSDALLGAKCPLISQINFEQTRSAFSSGLWISISNVNVNLRIHRLEVTVVDTSGDSLPTNTNQIVNIATPDFFQTDLQSFLKCNRSFEPFAQSLNFSLPGLSIGNFEILSTCGSLRIRLFSNESLCFDLVKNVNELAFLKNQIYSSSFIPEEPLDQDFSTVINTLNADSILVLLTIVELYTIQFEALNALYASNFEILNSSFGSPNQSDVDLIAANWNDFLRISELIRQKLILNAVDVESNWANTVNAIEENKLTTQEILIEIYEGLQQGQNISLLITNTSNLLEEISIASNQSISLILQKQQEVNDSINALKAIARNAGPFDQVLAEFANGTLSNDITYTFPLVDQKTWDLFTKLSDLIKKVGDVIKECILDPINCVLPPTGDSCRVLKYRGSPKLFSFKCRAFLGINLNLGICRRICGFLSVFMLVLLTILLLIIVPIIIKLIRCCTRSRKRSRSGKNEGRRETRRRRKKSKKESRQKNNTVKRSVGDNKTTQKRNSQSNLYQ